MGMEVQNQEIEVYCEIFYIRMIILNNDDGNGVPIIIPSIAEHRLKPTFLVIGR